MLSDNTVSFVMTTDELIAVEPKDTLAHVRKLLTEHPIHHVLVLDGNKLVGILSPTDLLRKGVDPDVPADSAVGAQYSVAQAMETRLVTLHPKDTLLHAAKLFSQESFNSLPVVDEWGELVGILTTRDLLRFMIEAEDDAAPSR